MPNLINQDAAGNTFYNYLTLLVKGEVGESTKNISSFLNTAIGSSNHFYDSENVRRFVRFPATGIETKTGTVSTSISTWRIQVNETALNFNQYFGSYPSVSTNNSSSGSASYTSGSGGAGDSTGRFCFRVANQYSFVSATFSSSTLTTLSDFCYFGWLREPSYTGTVYPRGFVFIQLVGSEYFRVTTEGGTSITTLSTANNAITNPAITCSITTSGADWTDIVIRDAAAPNYAIGKLYNCVSVPNSFTVGQVIKNLGVDPEGSTQNKWLVVMPWGGRKLAMRVWTEGYT